MLVSVCLHECEHILPAFDLITIWNCVQICQFFEHIWRKKSNEQKKGKRKTCAIRLGWRKKKRKIWRTNCFDLDKKCICSIDNDFYRKILLIFACLLIEIGLFVKPLLKDRDTIHTHTHNGIQFQFLYMHIALKSLKTLIMTLSKWVNVERGKAVVVEEEKV